MPTRCRRSVRWSVVTIAIIHCFQRKNMLDWCCRLASATTRFGADVMQTLDFSGKTVIITGGLQGIGQAISELFLAAGANVVIGDILCPPGAGPAGDRLMTLRTDVTCRAQAEDLIAYAITHFGT